MATDLSTVNVEEGFYPRFENSFREHYGPESVFVRAVADSFTLALSRLLDSRGMLTKGTIIPTLGSEEATLTLGRLLRTAPSIRNTLLQEAFGAVPLGSYCAALDDIMGVSFFAGWLASVQAEDYATANQLIPNEPTTGAA